MMARLFLFNSGVLLAPSVKRRTLHTIKQQHVSGAAALRVQANISVWCSLQTWKMKAALVGHI